MMPPSNKLGDYLHYFLSCWLPEHRQVSAHTLAGYKQTFRLLLRYWKARFPERPHPNLEELQVPQLLEFLSHLERERANSVSTRNARLAALKSFFKMVALLDPARQDQARRIRLIPLKRTSVRRFDYLDKREVDILFAGVDTRSPDGYRDLVILRTLYNTGARASELCALRLPDLDLAQKQLHLFGKGRKPRLLPLWDSTTAFLTTYLKSERRHPLKGHEQRVFINQRGAGLTRSGLYVLCKKYLLRAAQKVPTLQRKQIHPVHGWRYTTASHLVLAGVDPTVIQEWLGHVSINTTCRYKSVSLELKREALKKFYLFESARPEGATAQVDWTRYPDLLAYLEAL